MQKLFKKFLNCHQYIPCRLRYVSFSETIYKPTMENQQHVTKQYIFDLFYQVSDCTRSGGGKVKKRMCRQCVSHETVKMLRTQTLDPITKLYLDKILARAVDIAPPPRPKQ